MSLRKEALQTPAADRSLPAGRQRNADQGREETVLKGCQHGRSRVADPVGQEQYWLQGGVSKQGPVPG